MPRGEDTSKGCLPSPAPLPPAHVGGLVPLNLAPTPEPEGQGHPCPVRGEGGTGRGDGENKAWPHFAKVQVVSSSGTEVRDTSLAPYLIQGVDGLPWP